MPLFTVIAATSIEDGLAKASESAKAWTLRAALGQCGWVCADCCCSFPTGMPDKCTYNDQRCNDIIKRDKAEAHQLHQHSAHSK